MSFPSAIVNGDASRAKASDSSTSRKYTGSTCRLGTSMPTTAFPGTGAAMRSAADAEAGNDRPPAPVHDCRLHAAAGQGLAQLRGAVRLRVGPGPPGCAGPLHQGRRRHAETDADAPIPQPEHRSHVVGPIAAVAVV